MRAVETRSTARQTKCPSGQGKDREDQQRLILPGKRWRGAAARRAMPTSKPHAPSSSSQSPFVVDDGDVATPFHAMERGERTDRIPGTGYLKFQVDVTVKNGQHEERQTNGRSSGSATSPSPSPPPPPPPSPAPSRNGPAVRAALPVAWPSAPRVLRLSTCGPLLPPRRQATPSSPSVVPAGGGRRAFGGLLEVHA